MQEGICLAGGLCKGVWNYYKDFLPSEDIKPISKESCQFFLKNPYVEKYFIKKMQEERKISITPSKATKIASNIVITCLEKVIELDVPVPHPEEKELQEIILKAGATKPTVPVHEHTYANHLHFLIYDISTFKKVAEILDIFRVKGVKEVKSYLTQKAALSFLGVWFIINWFKKRKKII